MFKIIGTSMYLTRGDTAEFTISIKQPNVPHEEYELQTGDIIVFSVKQNVDDINHAFQKTFVSKAVKIFPEDTNNLDFGDYLYDIQLTFANDDVNTIIPPSLFKIEEEIS